MDEKMKLIRTQYESTLSSQQKELLRAVETDSLPEVKRIFDGLSKLERQEKWFDYVLLTTAVEKGHKSVIQFLLTSNCRVTTDMKTQFLCTPLYYATVQNDAEIAYDLLKKGASIHHKDMNEETPLEFAMQNEKFEIVNVILRDCDPIKTFKNLDHKRNSDVALFHMVCYGCNLKGIKMFLERGFSVYSRSSFNKEEWKGFTPLHFTVAGPQTWSRDSSIGLLLEYNADILAKDEKGMTPVHIAFRNEEYRGSSSSPFHQEFINKWVDCLIETKFSNLKDDNGLRLFHIICCGSKDRNKTSKCVDAVQSFLDNGGDINTSVSSNDPDFPEFTALHFAVKNFCFDIVKLLLQNGADIKKTDAKGRTPLHVACDYLSMPSKTSWSREPIIKNASVLEIVNLLLDRGADVGAKDLEGGTPLHYSFYTREERKPLASLLLPKCQLSSNLIDRNGLSHLHIASSLNLSAVETLIKGGASVHSRVNSDVPWATLRESGYCALHFAISYNKLGIVRYLLDHGADVNTRIDNRQEYTPLHLASQCEISQLKDIILHDTDSCGAIQSYINDRSDIIRSLIEHGAAVDDRDAIGNTALLIACRIPSDFEIMDLNPSPINSVSEDEDSDPSIHFFSQNSNKRSGPPKDVLVRLFDGQLSTIKILLQHGADVHARSKGGSTVLHEITNQGDLRQKEVLSEIMLKRGVDINATYDTSTSLHYVVHSYLGKPTQNMSLLYLYFRYGADINANCNCWGTVLHMVANDEDVDEVEYEPEHRRLIQSLIDHPEVDLDALDKHGRTPLHIAVEDYTGKSQSFRWGVDPSLPKLRNFLCIENLLNAGADIHIKNLKGSSPLDQLYNWLVNNFSRYSRSQFPVGRHSRIFISFITYLKKLLKMNVSNSDEIKNKVDALSRLRPELDKPVDSLINREVKKLKSIVIDPYTSLFDILLKDPTDMAKHVKNENLKKIMESDRFCIDFLMFHNLLILQFQRGLIRNSALESAKNALANLSRIDWPSSCSEHILRYLNSESLANLLQSVSAEKLPKKSTQNPSVDEELRPKIRRHRYPLHWIEDIEAYVHSARKKENPVRFR